LLRIIFIEPAHDGVAAVAAFNKRVFIFGHVKTAKKLLGTSLSVLEKSVFIYTRLPLAEEQDEGIMVSSIDYLLLSRRRGRDRRLFVAAGVGCWFSRRPYLWLAPGKF
jgi:hypothetical protein